MCKLIYRMVAAVAGCSLLVIVDAGAQNYPTKPVRLLVGAAPGGATDLVARIIGRKMSEMLGQQVIVDNRPGANQRIAAELTAKAPPDGYTLLMAPAGFSINPALYKKMAYDARKDFSPVAMVALAPNVLVIHPSLPSRSIKELVALARAKPGALSYGSSGVGAPSHLAGALFVLLTKTKMVHVPYKGSGPAIVDLIAGNIQLSFPSIPGAIPHIASKRLVALGVTSSKRSSSLKTVPTIEEAGVPGYEVGSWFGIVAPAGVSSQVIARLNDVINRGLQAPELREVLLKGGAEPLGGTPEEFGKTIDSDIRKWIDVLKEAKIPQQ